MIKKVLFMTKTLYKIPQNFELSQRKWPNHTISKAPHWCSLDLYLGQQSLLSPMNINQKLLMFTTLKDLGFTEISISNPGSSETNLIFLNRLIEEDLIPEHVKIQITLSCEPDLIAKSIVLLKNLKNITIQLEIPCSANFINLIFAKDIAAFKEQVIESASVIKHEIEKHLSHVNVQYSMSLEDFMGAQPQDIMELADSVAKNWLPAKLPLIVHLPNTVDYNSPSHYADGIEWFIKNFNYAEQSIFSGFSKNNRGNAVAACELALQAGVTRIEGSLLGIGERAGNNDLITMILNLQSINVPTHIEIKNINKLNEIIQETTRVAIPVRHPYLGELSFTALSKYQQGIIFKGLSRYETATDKVWDIPYLTLNPTDIGRVYEAVKYQLIDESNDRLITLLTTNFGFNLPELLAAEFSNLVKQKYPETTENIPATVVRDMFIDTYTRNREPIELKSINFEKATINSENDQLHCHAAIEFKSEKYNLTGVGDGALSTLVNAFAEGLDLVVDVASFFQHALASGSNALAATYIKIVTKDAKGYWGVGIDADSTLSVIKAFFNALNRSQQHRSQQHKN